MYRFCAVEADAEVADFGMPFRRPQIARFGPDFHRADTAPETNSFSARINSCRSIGFGITFGGSLKQ
jgi:hypothetical protein